MMTGQLIVGLVFYCFLMEKILSLAGCEPGLKSS